MSDRLMVTSSNKITKSRWSPSKRLKAVFLRSEALRGYALISPTVLIMIVAMCVPFAITIIVSFWTQNGISFDTTWHLNNYGKLAENPIYKTLLIRSLLISASCTFATVLLSYPMAYYVAFHVKRRKLLWLVMMTVPFWTSYLLRVFAWKVILGYNGAINSGLKLMELIDAPLEFLLYSPSAVVITLTHAWAAFAILPMYVSLEKIDRTLLEAATDLGDGPVMRFLRVTLPLSLPGIVAATLIIFIPTVGDFVTPALVGGPDGMMIANLIRTMFGRINDWPLGATLSIAMMITIACISIIYTWGTKKLTEKIQ
jgi:spermidine/putrescine transport system permease protein